MAAPMSYITIKAMVDYNTRIAAKNRGFSFDYDTKQWLKKVHPMDLDFERKKADFHIKVLETNQTYPPL